MSPIVNRYPVSQWEWVSRSEFNSFWFCNKMQTQNVSDLDCTRYTCRGSVLVEVKHTSAHNVRKRSILTTNNRQGIARVSTWSSARWGQTFVQREFQRVCSDKRKDLCKVFGEVEHFKHFGGALEEEPQQLYYYLIRYGIFHAQHGKLSLVPASSQVNVHDHPRKI